jgi:hypothetical protein
MAWIYVVAGHHHDHAEKSQRILCVFGVCFVKDLDFAFVAKVHHGKGRGHPVEFGVLIVEVHYANEMEPNACDEVDQKEKEQNHFKNLQPCLLNRGLLD